MVSCFFASRSFVKHLYIHIFIFMCECVCVRVLVFVFVFVACCCANRLLHFVKGAKCKPNQLIAGSL